MLFSILKKILTAIPVLLVVSIVLFLLLNVMPGDAADSMSTMDATAEEVESAAARSLGLNDPMYIQYLRWLKNVLKGDFGISFLNGASVTEKIVTRLPVTLELTLLAMLIAVAIALPMGVLSATHRNSTIDAIASFISMIGVAVPHFWLAMMLIIIFSVNLHWLPASGFTPISQGLGKNLIKMIMPAFSGWPRICGNGHAPDTLQYDRRSRHRLYQHREGQGNVQIRRGVEAWRQKRPDPRHNGHRYADGAAFSAVPSWWKRCLDCRGSGTAIVQSIFSRDYQMTMGCVMMVAVIIILINTIVDILYVIIDPRVRTTRKSGAK